jgi:ferredoxin
MLRTSRYTEAQVREAVASSPSLTEALRKLGLRPAGGNHGTLKKLIERYDISTDHFEPVWARRHTRPSKAIPLSEILVEHSTYSRSTLKQRLYDAGLKQRQCELCGQDEMWRGLRMALILDHINGMATDNRIENLRIVCPNCAATLDTHCGRKNRLAVDPRNCLHCGKEFLPKYDTHRYCSQPCGIHSKGPRDPHPERRKVPRPSYEQLMADVQAMSFVAIVASTASRTTPCANGSAGTSINARWRRGGRNDPRRRTRPHDRHWRSRRQGLTSARRGRAGADREHGPSI